MPKKNIDVIISQFFSAVYNYLTLEYKPKYAKIYISTKHNRIMKNIIGQYYFGGNNIPDTARVVVDYIKKNKLS